MLPDIFVQRVSGDYRRTLPLLHPGSASANGTRQGTNLQKVARATSYYKDRLLKTAQKANEKSGRISFITMQYDNRRGLRSVVGAGVPEPVAEELENMFHAAMAGRAQKRPRAPGIINPSTRLNRMFPTSSAPSGPSQGRPEKYASIDMASNQQQREQLLLELQEHEDVQLWQERQEHLLEQQWLEQQVQDHQEELQQEELQQQEDEDQQQQQGAMLPRSTSATLGSLEANVLSAVLSNSNLGSGLDAR